MVSQMGEVALTIVYLFSTGDDRDAGIDGVGAEGVFDPHLWPCKNCGVIGAPPNTMNRALCMNSTTPSYVVPIIFPF